MAEAQRTSAPIATAGALRTLLAEVYPGEDIGLPAHLDAVLDRHHRLGDQRPATCPAYALSYLLPARGFTELEGHSLAAEDYLAHLVGVTIEATEDPASYGFAMPSSADPSQVGASPEGVTRAVALGSHGRLVTVPVPGRSADGRPQLTAAAWEALLESIEPGFLAGEVDVVFNYESDQLLAARDAAYNAANLRRLDAEAVIPHDNWAVGHYAPLGAIWRRPSGERWLVLLNSFKGRGFAGIEPQPAELMRRGVVREDGRRGGMLLIATRERGSELTAAVEALGLEVKTWSNGSPAPADWRWEPGR